MKRRTHQEFLEDLLISNEHYRLGKFTVEGEFKNTASEILLGTNYGYVSVRANRLLSGLGFTIESAIDQDEFAKNKIRELYGNDFNLDKLVYTRGRDNVIIGCKKHGDVSVSYNNLMNRGCPRCGNELKMEQSVKNGGWGHSDWEKRGKSSEYFDSYKMYVIRCWSEDEEFYKIGKTFYTISGRMKGNNRCVVMPYKWEVVQEYILDSGVNISKFELEAKKLLKEYKYKPKIKFSGHTECYSRLL